MPLVLQLVLLKSFAVGSVSSVRQCLFSFLDHWMMALWVPFLSHHFVCASCLSFCSADLKHSMSINLHSKHVRKTVDSNSPFLIDQPPSSLSTPFLHHPTNYLKELAVSNPSSQTVHTPLVIYPLPFPVSPVR